VLGLSAVDMGTAGHGAAERWKLDRLCCLPCHWVVRSLLTVFIQGSLDMQVYGRYRVEEEVAVVANINAFLLG